MDQSTVPGDFKYKDLNGDGFLSEDGYDRIR